MACVSRSYGGDCGDDPPEDPNWRPPDLSECANNTCTRGVTTNQELRKLLKANNNRPLQIEFDTNDQQTGRPVGPNASRFSNLVGTLVEKVPKCYSSWDSVPESSISAIWPKIETYFDMRRHWRGPFSDMILLGVNANMADRYRDRKYKFKTKWFTKRGGNEHPREIRRFPPPNMEVDDWSKHVELYTSELYKRRSSANKSNRRKQKYSSIHGTKAYAARRYEERSSNGKYGSLINDFEKMHQNRNTHEWVNDYAKNKHKLLVEQRATQEESSNPLSEEDIMEQTLGATRGHYSGRGRKLGIGASSNSSASVRSQAPRFYTQQEFHEIIQTQQSQLQSQAEYMATLHNALTRANISIPQPPPFRPAPYSAHVEGGGGGGEEEEEDLDDDE